MTPINAAYADPYAVPMDEFGEEPLESVNEDDVHWPARLARGLFEALMAKERMYFQALEVWGLLNMWRLANAQYYGRNPDAYSEMETQQIGFDGEEGELVRFRINDTRSYIRQQIAMACQQRPSFQAIATNTDYASRAQISSSDAAVDYIYAKSFGEKKERRVVEKGLVFGLGWTWLQWDADGGEFVDAPLPLPDGSPSPATEYKRSGAPFVRQMWPGAVVCEPYIEDDDEHVWRMVRDRRSKGELCAEFPQYREAIKGVPTQDDYTFEAVMQLDALMTERDDRVTVRHFYHDRTAAMPDGRYAVMVGDILLQDGPLPEDKLSEILIPFCPGHHMGSVFGYADSWDLMPIQQMQDELASACATNLANYARQTIWGEDGTDFDLQALANGARFLTTTAGKRKPEPLQLAQLPPASQWFFALLDKKMQGLSGMNSVVRGQPDSNITSGTMAALFHSIAQEFNNAIQAAVDEHRERVANGALGMVKRHAKAPFMVQVAGVDERPYLASYTVDKLAGFDRVVIKTANPLAKSAAGRIELFNMLIKVPHAIENPEQAVALLHTGIWKPVTDVQQRRLMRIQWENEQLMEGVSPPVLFSDNIMMESELKEHLKLADSPEWRMQMMQMTPEQQAGAGAALQKHIAEHFRVWREQTPPDAAHALGIPLHPMMAQAMGLSAPPSNDNDGGKKPEAKGGGPSSDDKRSPQARDEGSGVALPRPAEPPPGSKAQSAA